MKKFRYVFFLSIPLFTLWFCTSSSSVKEKATGNGVQGETKTSAGNNVAVLELFTSQGCSSCPAADRLLDEYSKKENVIALSFHVDYWNKLGWKDPYSSSVYTQRQYKYASSLHSQVYTPQLVINGEVEMVGSDAKKIDNTLKKVWSQDTNSNLSIENVRLENGKANINYTVKGIERNLLLNIALIEKKTETAIKSGENGGVTLHGTNVVRNFKTISKPVEGKSIYAIDVPEGIDLKNISIILYLQESNNRIIAGQQAQITM
ncbi:MAG: DUF1223 domain-containing protein [Ginsengibacter sp.]